VYKLPEIVKQQCCKQESNPRPLKLESNTVLLVHSATWTTVSPFIAFSVSASSDFRALYKCCIIIIIVIRHTRSQLLLIH